MAQKYCEQACMNFLILDPTGNLSGAIIKAFAACADGKLLDGLTHVLLNEQQFAEALGPMGIGFRHTGIGPLA